jgi:hypothetical protein
MVKSAFQNLHVAMISLKRWRKEACPSHVKNGNMLYPTLFIDIYLTYWRIGKLNFGGIYTYIPMALQPNFGPWPPP